MAVTQLMPFLYPVSDRDRPNFYHIQARMGCPPLIFLDGHPLGPRPTSGLGRRWESKIRSPDDLEPIVGPLIDDHVSLWEIAALEVYRGASDVPGEFSLDGSHCGVVAVWSKRGITR